MIATRVLVSMLVWKLGAAFAPISPFTQASKITARGGGRAGQRTPWRLASRPAAAAAPVTAPAASLADEVRGDFPILTRLGGGGQPLVYLDNAATSQKPRAVIDAVSRYYEESNSNVHRSAHFLSNRATELYEGARDKVARFIGAARREEVVFTRGATEAINLVANTWGERHLTAGDEIVLSVAEHHSNLVPWQLLAARKGLALRFVKLDAAGRYDVAHLATLLGPRTKLVCLAHASNVLGALHPVAAVVRLARQAGARVLLDACQTVPHMPMNAKGLGVDWLVASGHKMLGPTGIGFLWGRHEVLLDSPPWQGGGEMVDEVFLDRPTTFAPPPGRFEAGTPAIAGAVGLGAACDYLSGLGMARVQAHGAALAEDLWRRLGDHCLGPLVRHGPSPEACAEASAEASARANVGSSVGASSSSGGSSSGSGSSGGSRGGSGGSTSSSTSGGGDGAVLGGSGGVSSGRLPLVAFSSLHAHAADLAFFLDQRGVAVRSGHHCAQPLHRGGLGVAATCRASLYLYNDGGDVARLAEGLEHALEVLAPGRERA